MAQHLILQDQTSPLPRHSIHGTAIRLPAPERHPVNHPNGGIYGSHYGSPMELHTLGISSNTSGCIFPLVRHRASLRQTEKAEKGYTKDTRYYIPAPSNRLFGDLNRWFLGTCCHQEAPVGGCWYLYLYMHKNRLRTSNDSFYPTWRSKIHDYAYESFGLSGALKHFHARRGRARLPGLGGHISQLRWC